MTVKVVIFDLFETLISGFDTGHPSTTEVAQTLELPVKDFQREYYQSIRPARYTGQFPDYATVLRYIVGKLGGKSPESTIKTLTERRQSAFNTHLRRIEPEILDMLNEITTLGIRLGLISNTDGSEVLDWQNSPLARFFEVTIFSHAVGMVKPDPHIYQHACKHLDVAPSDCIFIGDGNSDELRGAAQVGMSPFCAAWFLRQHTDLLGEDIVAQRAAGYPVLHHPSEVVSRIQDLCAAS
ncbi:MAG: HAD family hydrolase [Candidatus Poribacteria bacterium]|nr:HAD family hydrolase [Candidatus Poribacteria bacterium]